MPQSTDSLVRAIVGMVVGAVVMGILVGVVDTWAAANLHPGPESPAAPALIHLACDFVAAGAGGWICAFIARNARASIWMAALTLVIALGYQAAPANPGESSGYRLALLLVGPLGVYAGGWLRGG
jgi:hypothetical protein